MLTFAAFPRVGARPRLQHYSPRCQAQELADSSKQRRSAANPRNRRFRMRLLGGRLRGRRKIATGENDRGDQRRRGADRRGGRVDTEAREEPTRIGKRRRGRGKEGKRQPDVVPLLQQDKAQDRHKIFFSS